MACSHPERIVTLAQQVAAGAAVLEDQADAARGVLASVESVWQGSGAIAFETSGEQLARQLTRDASVLNDISSALMELAATLEGAHALWHQAEFARNAEVIALPLVPFATADADALGAQAHEQVTLAVQRAVLAFATITLDSWAFTGTAFGGLVHDIEQEFTGRWHPPRSLGVIDPSVDPLHASGGGGDVKPAPSAMPDFADPSRPPGPGWAWRGPGQPGSGQGAWYNPQTGESMHPDMQHPPPIGPHFDYIDAAGVRWRIFPDGRIEHK